MQTLGLAESTLRTESRLKSLFWPSIENAADVDYLGAQGYWVCTLVAVVSFVFTVVLGQPIAGAVTLLFYYLGGVGVRQRSRYAAVVVFVLYLAGVLIAGLSVVHVLFAALLLSNLRATWIASRWKPDSEEAAPPLRLNENWTDKLGDSFPQWLWPKVQVVYYVFSAGVLGLTAAGIVLTIARQAR